MRYGRLVVPIDIPQVLSTDWCEYDLVCPEHTGNCFSLTVGRISVIASSFRCNQSNSVKLLQNAVSQIDHYTLARSAFKNVSSKNLDHPEALGRLD